VSNDLLLSSLSSFPQDESERTLAARYAPVLLFDAREPFLPLATGYTIFRHDDSSPSFRQGHVVKLTLPDQPPAGLAIEYAIWWDWDIGHLYELEHVWVYVDEDGHVVRGEASWHGGYHDMRHDGVLALEGDHLVLYSEPGKHAFAPTPDWFRERRQRMKRTETRELAGIGGVLISPYLEGKVKPTPLKTRLAHTYLAQRAFEPSWDFSQVVQFAPEMLVPWPALLTWMPVRINSILEQLAGEIAPADYRFLRIGHRGAAAHAPDNSLLGFHKAAALGVDLVECDVRQTADGHLVLAHDAHLTDADGRVLLIGESTLAELQTIDLGLGERIPILAEAIELCQKEQLGAYIELKEWQSVPAVAEVIHKQKFAKQCIVGSLRPDWLMDMKVIAPELTTSILFDSPHLDAVKLAESVRATFVHPCWERFEHPSALLTPEWVACVRQADLGIICWCEGRPDEIAALRRAGVDGICSDAPELLLDGRSNYGKEKLGQDRS
jgi:glycerophosphoryl diester phosphodiesterase